MLNCNNKINPTDEYLNQIIEAQKKDKIDFDPSKYNIDDILNEDMDDELNMISDNNKNIKDYSVKKKTFQKKLQQNRQLKRKIKENQ